MGSRSRRSAGRAQVGRFVGRARAGRVVETAPTPADLTSVMPLGDDLPPPVFADASGRRRRRLRGIGYGLGVLALLLVAAFWLSQAGDPVNPGPVPPCPSATAVGGKAPTATAEGCAAGEASPTATVRGP